MRGRPLIIEAGAQMTYRAQLHEIHTKGDGLLASDLREVARAAAGAERVVIHFHGGLVTAEGGRRTAERLTADYQQAGVHPVFFVWRSGLLETLSGNLREILLEDLGRQLLRWLLRFAVGKLGQSDAQRAAGVITLPYEMEVNAELQAREAGHEPYAAVPVRREVAPAQPEELAQLVEEVAADEQVAAELEAVFATRDEGSRGVGPGRTARTALSPEVLAEIDPGPAAGERGLVSTALLAKKVAAVFAAVIGRFRAGTDHGVYPTVVEELLRELYLANVGAAIWSAMKKETADTFVADGKERGGAAFLREFGTALGESRPRISLVGHSTGAVFIDNFLRAFESAARDSSHQLPEDLRIDNVVLLAPACTFDHLAGALPHYERVDRLRVFTMDDTSEQRDHLVPGLYPRSLLFLVAGLLERDADGRSVVMPVAGLQRCYTNDAYAGLSGVREVREYVQADPGRLVWSPTAADALAGARCGAVRHAAFDEDPGVLESLRTLLAGGRL